MFRNQYDTDVTTFSPAGRLHQVDYACEAVKRGSACVGLTSSDYAVLVVLRRAPNELASHQRKIFKIDEHLAIGISGLVGDGRVVAEYMREEALNHRFVYGTPINSGRLVQALSDKSQWYTQSSSGRPYGVGLLVIGYDRATGPHLFETSPAGIHFEFRAQAIGARSQTCKTYLESNLDSLNNASLDDLIVHGLKSIRGSAHDGVLTNENCSVAVVGKDQPLKLIRGSDLDGFLSQLPAIPKRERAEDVKEAEMQVDELQ